MIINPTDPRFEFRLFGQNLGRTIGAMLALSPTDVRNGEVHDEGVQTYLLSPANQRYNIKLREGKLDIKLLVRQHHSLERWHPYLQLAFPLTSAFLHEFLFAWLEIEPPLLRRDQYTERQFLQEVILPNPHLRAVEVYKQRRHYSVNGCQAEITALTVDDRHHLHTVAVEATDADVLLQTLALLRLHTLANTNYIVGLSDLLEREARAKQQPTRHAEEFTPNFTPSTTPELVLVR